MGVPELEPAAAVAQSAAARVRDSPQARLALLRELYRVPAAVDRGYLPCRRGASAFMNWQLRRGVLNPLDAPQSRSPWWRAVNGGLLLDTAERYIAIEHGFGRLLDVGIITPRIRVLFNWSARELELPNMSTLIDGQTLSYAWDSRTSHDADVWRFEPTRLARLARRLVPMSENLSENTE